MPTIHTAPLAHPNAARRIPTSSPPYSNRHGRARLKACGLHVPKLERRELAGKALATACARPVESTAMRARRRVAIALAVVIALAGTALLVTRLPPFGGALTGARLERAQRSPHHERGAFHNLEPTHKLTPGTFTQMLRHQFFGDEVRVPPRPLAVIARSAADYATPPATGLRATWFGHASVLLELAGRRVLTDPVWSERCSPFGFVGPRRFAPLPIALAALPEIDVVVISHDHYDHLDMATIQALSRRGARFVVPLGIGAHLQRWGVPGDRISELDWYEHVSRDGVRITATPARHYSGRGVLDGDATLWASWVIASDRQRVFFSGDTGYSREFARIGARFGPFDLTLIKIGASDPTWQQIHMSPEEAVRTHRDVRGALLLPIHWGTFNLGNHAWNDPPERMLAAARAAGVDVVVPRPGQWVEPAAPPALETWWR
jgi:L-ascorbate metabolism protein UlaG (beta-lactamase superfamily)